MSNVPVWLLDIDGVLNAATKKPDRNVWPLADWVEGRARDDRREWPILAARPVVDFIREIYEKGRAEIRWHTTWQEWASVVSRLLDLPEFPVAKAPEWDAYLANDRVKLHDDEWWKIGAALRVVEDEERPLLWTDDDADSFWNLPAAVRTRIMSAQPTLIVAPSPYTGLPRAVLFDVDGTLALRDETDPNVRHFADWSRVGEDLPNPAVIELAQMVAWTGDYALIVMSGRDEACRRQTEMWLDAQDVHFDALHMRPAGDNRKDSVVKEELYRKHIEGRYSVVFVVDDRNQVVRMWRDVLGLTVFQVADGDF